MDKTFEQWYLQFRNEIAKEYDVNYSISVTSWTFSDAYKHYFDKGLTPKQAVVIYKNK